MRYLLLIFLFTSCTPTFYLKKAERALKKAEQLGADVSADTIYKEHTVIRTETLIDSIFTTRQGDTIRIYKDLLKIKYVRLAGDSVFIEGKCEADTVKIKVPYQVIKEIKSGHSNWDVIKWCLIVLVVAVLLTRLLWR